MPEAVVADSQHPFRSDGWDSLPPRMACKFNPSNEAGPESIKAFLCLPGVTVSSLSMRRGVDFRWTISLEVETGLIRSLADQAMIDGIGLLKLRGASFTDPFTIVDHRILRRWGQFPLGGLPMLPPIPWQH